jgi:hypothetical protein
MVRDMGTTDPFSSGRALRPEMPSRGCRSVQSVLGGGLGRTDRVYGAALAPRRTLRLLWAYRLTNIGSPRTLNRV